MFLLSVRKAQENRYVSKKGFLSFLNVQLVYKYIFKKQIYFTIGFEVVH